MEVPSDHTGGGTMGEGGEILSINLYAPFGTGRRLGVTFGREKGEWRKEMFRPRRSFSRHVSSFFGQTIFCLTSPTVGMGRGEKLKSEEACKKNFESPNFRVSLAEKRNDHKRKNATSFARHAKRKKRRQTPHRHHPPAPPPSPMFALACCQLVL